MAARVFLSYARADSAVVRAFADELLVRGLDVSLDVEFLRAGESWVDAILDHIRTADAFVVFSSPASIGSEWVNRELTTFIAATDRPVVPVLIGEVDFADLPVLLRGRQGVVIGDPTDLLQVAAAAAEVATALGGLAPGSPIPASAEHQAERLADGIAENLRRPPDTPAPSHHVFLVHGHDLEFRNEVEQHLTELGLRAVILSKVESEQRSLLDRFESVAVEAAFAVVLLSADDVGTGVRQFAASGRRKRSLRYRARQNVVLELGFFYGRLGWERVLVIEKASEENWPEFERPSDLAGVVFVRAGGDADWRSELAQKLTRAGMLGS